MPQILPSPSGGANPWGQLTQPYNGNMLGQGLRYLDSSQQRHTDERMMNADREAQMRQAMLGAAGTMHQNGTQGAAMIQSMAPHYGMQAPANYTGAMQNQNNYNESQQAANAGQFATAARNSVMGGALARPTPYQYGGNAPIAIGARQATRPISGKGSSGDPEFEQSFGMLNGKPYGSSTGKLKGDPRAVQRKYRQMQGGGGAVNAPPPITPRVDETAPAAEAAPEAATGDEAIIQEYTAAFEGATDVEIVNYGGKRVVMARNPDGKLTITELNE